MIPINPLLPIYKTPTTTSIPIIPTAPKTIKEIPSALEASTYDTLQSIRYQLGEVTKQLLDVLGQIGR